MGTEHLDTTESRLQAKQRGRQDINIDPTGWPEKNQKVTITDSKDSGVSYYGWFWNRSHMVADSLGGDPIKENLVTGTRTQNVGLSKDHTGGMAYAETKARDYLDNPDNTQCPLYYAVTPNYQNSELIPRTVSIDMESPKEGDFKMTKHTCLCCDYSDQFPCDCTDCNGFDDCDCFYCHGDEG